MEKERVTTEGGRKERSAIFFS